jgi:hypothetical protein
MAMTSRGEHTLGTTIRLNFQRTTLLSFTVCRLRLRRSTPYAPSIACPDALAHRFQAPSFHRVVLAANQDVSGCALLTVTTAAKNAGLQNAVGIGFWSTQAMGGNQAAEDAGRFIPKNQLKSVGTAALKSGDPATLHEFVGVVNCPGSGSEQAARLFKPYMQFEDNNGRVVRNWDLASNYFIDLTSAKIDRSVEVLRQ